MIVDWFCVQRCRHCFTAFDWTEKRPYTLCQVCASTVEVSAQIDIVQDNDTVLPVGFAVPYDNPVVSRVVRRLKFDGDAICAIDLAFWAEGACESLLQDMGAIPHVVPVPLHWTRLWQRGYNQSHKIAEALCDNIGLPLSPHILRRARRTKPHAKLDKETRAQNIVGAFHAKRAPRNAPSILLVDDVLTTGATLLACTKSLHAAGYQTVTALTVARTP